MSWRIPHEDNEISGETIFPLSKPAAALMKIKRVFAGETYVRFERVFTQKRRMYLERVARWEITG